jgi:hypothetical protein
MNIGPFSFPIGPLILLVSVAIALLVARFAGRGTPHAERAVVNSVIVGLVVSRLSFVAHYLPAYKGDVVKMLDFRDLGFDLLPGVVAGALLLLWVVMRRVQSRRAAILAALAGVFSWSIATAFAGTGSESASLPAVSVVDMTANRWWSICGQAGAHPAAAKCRSWLRHNANLSEWTWHSSIKANLARRSAILSRPKGFPCRIWCLTHRWRLRARSAPGRIQPRFSMTEKANCWLSILGHFRKQRFRTHLRRCIRLLSLQDARTRHPPQYAMPRRLDHYSLRFPAQP